MSQLGDVLELMYDARARYRTLRATITTWRHDERAQKAFRKSVERPRGGSFGLMKLHSVGGPSEPIPDTVEASVNVWLEWPRRCREERATDHGGRPSPSTRVVDGERWWSFDEQMGAVSNEGAGDAQSGFLDEFIHMLDPARLLASLELDPKGPTEVAGRQGVLVEARVREDLDRFDRWSFQLGAADLHRFVVDSERGVLLWVESIFEGLPVSITEITDVAFDETLPPDTFVLRPPAGEAVRPISEVFPHPQDAVSIDQVAREAPFSVFVPSRVPEGSHLHLTYVRGMERPKMLPMVSMSYTVPAHGSFHLTQSAAEGDEFFWFEGERVERDGQELLVGETGGELQLLLDREGTRVFFTGQGIARDLLVEVALSLVSAPTEPPRLTG